MLWLDVRGGVDLPSYAASAKGELASYESGQGCYLYGPIVKELDARAFVAELEAVGMVSSLFSKEYEKAPRYWVYFGPMDDYAGALAQLKEFDGLGIDSFIITRDDLYGALSLGVFENIDSARRMQAIMSAKNYQVSIRNIFTFEKRWWVEIQASKTGLKLNKINEIAHNYGIAPENKEFFCKTVAKAKSFP